jgi:hypothetical protein
MKTTKVGMFVLLSLSIAAVVAGTASLNLITPVFAGGDHHHGDQKCKNNDDNNCNDTHKTQKIKARNECEIDNKNKDHSSKNDNLNELRCSNEAANLKHVAEISGPVDGGLEAASAQADNSNQTQ